MCGLVAAYRYRPDAPPIKAAAIIQARDMMAHRGPDGAGLWASADGRAILGHRRLAIIDPLPRGAQPMTDDEAALTIVFNGEIYNCRELRQELSALGSTFRTATDTEVVLHVYRRFGVDGLSRLRGMFAFALWDERRQGLLLARDGLGIKPLYVFDIGGMVAAASEFRALRSLLPEGASRRPDMAGHVGFFLYGWIPEPFSPLAEIRVLPAGSWRWTDPSGTRSGRFFDIVDAITAAEADADTRPAARFEESLEALRDGIGDSVARHLIADVPVSLFLSAGADSAVIASLARDATDGPLAAITLGADRFRGTPDDEVPGAADTARSLALTHHVHWLTGNDFSGNREHLLAAMDVPTIDGVNGFFVAKATAEHGFKVALSGLGGDELLGGYPSFRQIPALVAALGPAARIPGLGRGLRMATRRLIARFTSPKYASVLELAGSYPGAYQLRRGLFLPWELEGWADAADLADALERLRAETGFDKRYDGIRSPFLRVLALETELYMRGQLLRDSDWAGMAFALEIRPPLVDTVLFRAAVRLIAAMTPPPTKADLGRVVGSTAHRAALRRKTGFSLPIRSWMMESGDPAGSGAERGLRGWSRIVYRDWCRRHGVDPVLNPGRG